MKTFYLYSLLALFIIILIFCYINISIILPVPSDYYMLEQNHFLKKIDYFSTYHVVTKDDANYNVTIRNVTDICKLDTGTLIRSLINSHSLITLLPEDSKDTYVIDRFNESDYNINLNKIKWMKPWQIVENITLNDNIRLLRQIILIAIIFITTYLIMHIFKLGRITNIFHMNKK